MALTPTPPHRPTVAVDGAVLEGYVGTYQVAPGLPLEVTREVDRLFVRATTATLIQNGQSIPVPRIEGRPLGGERSPDRVGRGAEAHPVPDRSRRVPGRR